MASPNRKLVIGNDVPNRWGIAMAGVVMQIALGAVYAWSVFRIPLSKTFGWDNFASYVHLQPGHP